MSMKGIPQHILERLELSYGKKLEQEAPTIKKIIHHPMPCEDCGLTVTDRRIDMRHRQTPHLHWAVGCSSCDKMRDPDTKQFTITKDEYAAVLKARENTRDK